jgi:putative PEP-CTERM system histidine kinase
MDVGFYSYLGAAAGFCFLTVLLLISGRGSVQGRLLTAVVIISAIWAGLAATIADDVAYQVFEILRYLAWYVFLLKLLEPAAAQNTGYRRFLRWALPLTTGFGILILVGELSAVYLLSPIQEHKLTALIITGHVLLAIIGLAIIEQLFRNTSISHRWAIKYLFIGAGGIFAFDFFLYADALLLRSIEQELWDARGIVNLVAVPLLAIAAARNRQWSINIFVSRDIVLNTTAILGAGMYLLVMAGAGFYLREFGGSWGGIGQILFFTLAIVLLVLVLFSGQLRAQLRVFLAKHFYANKYDYRREWLHLTRELNEKARGENRYEAVIRVMAHIVDARAGLLWVRGDHERFENVAAWKMDPVNAVEPGDGALVRFLRDKAYVINVTEFESHTDEYVGLDLPEWVGMVNRGWLIVPLFGEDSLLGFVILSNPLITRSINWEDRDLLMTAAKQVASYLTVLMTSEALAEARQFEVFNRLSAYMVHDLKNIAAELEMVAKNADKHKTNKDFLEDAFETVAGAAGEIKRLLEQLRSKRVQFDKKIVVDLGQLVKAVAREKQDRPPVSGLEEMREGCQVVVEKARLANVLAHLIDNARQATTEAGLVEVKLYTRESMCVVEIRDDGHGMEADFIKNRLFKPFDTTKGNAGMGIGMYESQEFIRQLGGEIQVQSEPGNGTVIALHIPAFNAQVEPQHANA